MTKTVIVIGCTKQKKPYKCAAEEMYSESALFSKTLEYIKSYYYEIDCVILSAKYGIINRADDIDTYDTKMAINPPEEILNSIKSKLSNYDKIICLCGSLYSGAIKKALPDKVVVEPMKGMGIGKRLQFLTIRRDCH